MDNCELDLEMAEMLPERETLGGFNFNVVVAPQINVAVLVNVLSPNSSQVAMQSNVGNYSFSA
jgi:hypothetical protein